MSESNSKLTQARLRELLRYDPATGVFEWNSRRGGNRSGLGAGTTIQRGYVRIGIDGEFHLAHRLAWMYVRGAWPAGVIDHKNGNTSDNSLENLRDATFTENQQNQQRAHAANKSCGLLGATFDRFTGRWMAKIRVNGKHKFLGRFDTAEEAHMCYVEAKRRLHAGSLLDVNPGVTSQAPA